MQYLYWALVVGGAYLLTAFTALPVFIILFFSIPFTIRLKKIGVVKNNKPIHRNLISILILGSIFIIAILLINKYTDYLVEFIIGAVIALLFSIGRLGENADNVKDYFETHKDCIDEQKVDEMYKKIKE